MFLIKDRFVLMMSALIATGLSWAFWDHTGNDVFTILGAVMLLVLIIENNLLRARIRSLEHRKR